MVGWFDNDDLTAVVSHALLNSMALVKSSLDTLAEAQELGEEATQELLSTARNQVDFVCDTLLDFARALPIDISTILNKSRGKKAS